MHAVFSELVISTCYKSQFQVRCLEDRRLEAVSCVGGRPEKIQRSFLITRP